MHILNTYIPALIFHLYCTYALIYTYIFELCTLEDLYCTSALIDTFIHALSILEDFYCTYALLDTYIPALSTLEVEHAEHVLPSMTLILCTYVARKGAPQFELAIPVQE